MLCFRYSPAAKKIMDKRGVVSRFSVESFLSQNAENFHRGTLLCCVSANFRQRKSLRIRRVYKDLPMKVFLSQNAGKFRRGNVLCCVSENLR